jgi:hypothetical protein
MNVIRICIFILMNTTMLLSQSYITSFGPRLYNNIGFSIQQRIEKNTTIELVIQNNKNLENPGLSLLCEQHFPLFTKRLNTYIGLGTHYFWDNQYLNNDSYKPFGLSTVVGLEFTIRRLNLSYDIMPLANFNENGMHFSSSTALSLRYVIIKQKKKKFNIKNIFKKKNN